MIVYSSLLSFQTPPSRPCVCSTLLIVCSSPIVCTCSSSPSVFSLCVPVSRCQFLFVSPCLKRPRDLMIIKFLVIFTEPCFCLTLIGIVCLFLDCLTCVPNLDWISFDFSCCPTRFGTLCLLLDCHSVYQKPFSKSHSLSSLSPSRAFESNPSQYITRTNKQDKKMKI